MKKMLIFALLLLLGLFNPLQLSADTCCECFVQWRSNAIANDALFFNAVTGCTPMFGNEPIGLDDWYSLGAEAYTAANEALNGNPYTGIGAQFGTALMFLSWADSYWQCYGEAQSLHNQADDMIWNNFEDCAYGCPMPLVCP